jgi:ABC-type multidrug transport system ATPase subunit
MSEPAPKPPAGPLADLRQPGGARLEVQALEKKIGGKRILGGYLSFALAPGSFVGLLGPSGSGKSTLLKACCGLERPIKGKVLLDGQDLYAQLGAWREQIGYVPQDDIIHQELSVSKAVDYAARLRLAADLPEKTRKALVTRVIHEVGLQDRANLRIRRLSGGQRKRASVAVELLNRPRILFLDEPTSGQDPQLEEALMQLFRQLSREGTTVIVTTHAMASIELLDTVILLQAGQLVWHGPPAQMLEFFETRSYEAIYKQLAKAPPGEWAGRFQQRRRSP